MASSERKVIHIVSTGCTASSYTFRQMYRHPTIYKYFSEPFNKPGQPQKWKNQVLRCVMLTQCDNPRILYNRLGIPPKDTQQIEKLNKSTIVFKTTQFIRFDLMYDLIFKPYPHILDTYYLIFLIRDPRGTYNSCKAHETYSEHDPQYLCNKFMQISKGIQKLKHKLPKIKIIAIYAEYIAYLQPQNYRDILYNFVDLDLNVDTVYHKDIIKPYNKTLMIYKQNRWIHTLNVSEIKMVQNIPSCAQWITQFGYNFVNLMDNEEYLHNFEANGLLSIEEMINTKNPFPMKQYLVNRNMNNFPSLNVDDTQSDTKRTAVQFNSDIVIHNYDSRYLILPPLFMILVFICMTNVFKKRLKSFCK